MDLSNLNSNALKQLDPNILLDICKNYLRSNGADEVCYAKIMAHLYTITVPEDIRIFYNTDTKEWLCEGKSLSDVKLFSIVSDVCDIARETIKTEWANSIFQCLVPEKIMRDIDTKLDNLEAVKKAQLILSNASELMVLKALTEDEPIDKEELSTPIGEEFPIAEDIPPEETFIESGFDWNMGQEEMAKSIEVEELER